MKYFTKLMLVLLWCIVGTTGAYAGFVLDQEITSIEDLAGKNFAIVNTTDGKAICNKKQNFSYDLQYLPYAEAFSSDVSGCTFRIEQINDESDAAANGKYLIRCLTGDGSEYTLDGWAAPYFQTNITGEGVCFFFALSFGNTVRGLDANNTAAWDIQYDSEHAAFTLQNVGTGKYYDDPTKDAMSDTPSYWSFYTLVEPIETGGDFDLKKQITSIEELDGKKFAIVNEAEGKALYGSSAQNLGYDIYKTAFSNKNTVVQWRHVVRDGKNLLRAVDPQGNDYNPFGGWNNSEGWLNSQPADGGCCFILSVGDQYGADFENGGAWEFVEGEGENEGKFALRNLGTGLYINKNDAPAKFEESEAVYWSFYTLVEAETDIPPMAMPDEEGWVDEDITYWKKNTSDAAAVEVSPESGIGKDDGYGIAVTSETNPNAAAWDTQFWVKFSEALPEGTKYIVQFDCMASKNAKVTTQAHAEPQDFAGNGIGDVIFKTKWKHIILEGTVKAENIGSKEFGSVAFNLAEEKTETEYRFANVQVFLNRPYVEGDPWDEGYTKIQERDWETTDSYPYYRMGVPTVDGEAAGAYDVDAEEKALLIENNATGKANWEFQPFVDDGIKTAKGNNYCVRMTVRTEGEGDANLNLVMGTWDGSADKGFKVKSNQDYETINFYLKDYPVTGVDKDGNPIVHVIIQCGSFVGKIYVKKVEIWEKMTERNQSLTDAATESKEALADVDAVYTQESVKALLDAIAAVEAAIGGEGEIDDLLSELESAKNSLTQREESFYSPLTKDMFFEWDGVGADANQKQPAAAERCIAKKIGQNTVVYGDANVSCKNYANLSDYMRLVIEGTPGMKLRVLLNRPEKLDGDNIPGNDNNGGPVDERKVELDENGQAVVDLFDDINSRINAIKTDWGTPVGMITQIYLQKKSYLVQKDAEFLAKSTEASPEDGVIADAWSSADGNSLEPTKDVEKAVAIWQDAEGNVDLRVAKDGAFIVSGPSSSEAIVKVVLEGAAISLTPSDGAWANQSAAAAARADEEPAAEEEAAPTRMVWVGNIDKVKFWADDLTRLSKITVVTADADGNTQAYEDKARPAGAPVADIASFNALEEGKVAVLKLNKAVVLAASEKNVVLEDNSGNLMLYNMGIEVEVGDSLSGELAGKHTIYKGMPEMTKDESTDVTKVTKVAGPAPEAKAVTLAELKAEANILKLVVISKAVIDSIDNKCFAKIEEESVQIYDTFGTRADWGIAKGNVYTTITGIVIPFKKDADTDMVFELAPRTAADLVLDADATGIRELNSVKLNGEVYNLQGQKMNGQLRKGLYIIDGKKVMVK